MKKVTEFFKNHRREIAVFMILMLCVAPMTAFAEEVDQAEVLWQLLMNLIKKWVTRGGAVVVFIGGLQFAGGWKSQDPEQKSRGIETVISGALIMAVAGLTATFFA